jgi:phosphohistidine phosphatase
MELILWRHADAETAGAGKPDGERPITGKGKKQARRMAAWLRKRLPDDARLLVSPAKRAQQTARALTDHFETAREVGTASGPQSVLKAAGWPDAEGTVVVVGHQPTLGQAAALALTGKAGDWSIKKGAIWWLVARSPNDIVVRAVIDPDLV